MGGVVGLLELDPVFERDFEVGVHHFLVEIEGEGVEVVDRNGLGLPNRVQEVSPHIHSTTDLIDWTVVCPEAFVLDGPTYQSHSSTSRGVARQEEDIQD